MYKCQTLKNGLTIIGEEIPYLKSISVRCLGKSWFYHGDKRK